MRQSLLSAIAYRDRDNALNLRDNGFNVIVGQRQGKTYEKAVEDGWVPGETLFSIEGLRQGHDHHVLIITTLP